MCYEYETIEDFASEMQKMINIWEVDLIVTGGEFFTEKIFSTPLISSGKVFIRSKYTSIIMQLKLSLMIAWKKNVSFNNLTQVFSVKTWDLLSRQM